MKDKSFLHERSRVLMAYELGIPPDDLDLDLILQSIFRAIRESCEINKKNNGEIILTIKDKEEEKVILSEIGQTIVVRIFENQYPFEGILERYENWYISNILTDPPSSNYKNN